MAWISFTDEVSFAVLTNCAPDHLGRFANWTTIKRPVGDTATRESDGARSIFRRRTDYGASFELRGIPTRLAARTHGNVLQAGSDFTNGVWSSVSATRTLDNTFPLSDWRGALPTTKILSTSTGLKSFTQNVAGLGANRIRYRAVLHQGTVIVHPGNAVHIFDNTGGVDLIGGTINYSTGVFTFGAFIGVNGKAWANPLGGGWFDVNLETDIIFGRTYTFYIGWTGGNVSNGDSFFASSAEVFPFVRSVDIADRLIAHLLNGGTCAVMTDDLEGNTYATCGLMPGTVPQLTLTDPKLLEYRLSLQLINLAVGPVPMVCHYV